MESPQVQNVFTKEQIEWNVRHASPNQQLSYNNSLTSNFRPISYVTSSPVPSDSVRNHEHKIFAQKQQQNHVYQPVPRKNAEFQSSIEVLAEIERQKGVKRLEEIEREQDIERLRQLQQIEHQLTIERLQKIETLHQLERQREINRQNQIERLSDNQFGRGDEQVIQEQQSATPPLQQQEEQDERYTKSQILYGQWLQRQRQLDPIPRPWTIWAIAIIDIVSVLPYVALVVYDLTMKPLSDPTTQLWRFFKVSVFTVIQLLMGIGLLNGLRSRDDSSTLWYCKMWIWCQSIFIVDSAFTLFSTLILAAQSTVLPANFSAFYSGIALKGAFRLISLILLIRFTNKLRDSQRVFKEAYKKQEEIHMQQQQQCEARGEHADAIRRYDQQRNAAGGDVISPYVAVVLGL